MIGYWTLDGVYADPCADTDAPPSAGDTVEDLAAAFAAQEITTTTEPAPVSVGGHDGLYLELSTPAGFDYRHLPRGRAAAHLARQPFHRRERTTTGTGSSTWTVTGC